MWLCLIDIYLAELKYVYCTHTTLVASQHISLALVTYTVENETFKNESMEHWLWTYMTKKWVASNVFLLRVTRPWSYIFLLHSTSQFKITNILTTTALINYECTVRWHGGVWWRLTFTVHRSVQECAELLLLYSGPGQNGIESAILAKG